MMKYGYARCSTSEKKQDIDRQVRELKQQGVQRKDVFLEYESGTKADRAELNKLLDIAQPGDTIIATEVSRLTRSTKQLCDIIEFVKQKKICLIFGTFRVDCTNGLDAMTEGMLKMMAVFSELERNIISERVKSGLVNARAKGKQLGRRRTTLDMLPQTFLKHYDKYKAGQITKTEYARLCGLTAPTIYKYLRLLEQSAEAKAE